MSILRGLSTAARSLVTEDFRNGTVPTVDVDTYVADLELGRKIDLSPLRAVVEAAMKRFPDPKKSDPWLGPRVHATLRLTRREAGDKRLWNYLTIVEFPDYVRWRWQNPDQPETAVTLDRFLGDDSKHALGRLWWAAETTRNGRDYARTEAGLGISRFSVSWLLLILIHHRAAALAVVDFLRSFQTHGATDTQGQVMAKAVNVALRTVCLDALAASPPVDVEAVHDWIVEPIDETTMMDELPVGPDEAPVPESDIVAVRRFLDDLASRIDLGEVKARKRNQPTGVTSEE